jgi:hypothetical protein
VLFVFGMALAILLTLLTILAVSFLVYIEASDSAAGCGSVDPTDPANYSTVIVRNNTTSPVVLSDCSGFYCDPGRLPAHLDPGKSFRDHAACNATGADMTSWSVSTQTGSSLGYIAVDSPKSREGLVFDVSRASPNRTTPTPTG